jgi:hypothetical protein
MNNEPLSKKLKMHFQKLVTDLKHLFQEIKVRFVDLDSPGVAVVAPRYYWNHRTPNQENARIRIKRDYERFFEMLNLLLAQAPNDLIKRFTDADKRFRMWMELKSNWGLSESMSDNLSQFEDAVKDVIEILSIFDQKPDGEILLIPDTNSLLANCDPVAYRAIIAEDTFTFLLLPSVLGELDKLKYLHRNPDIRDKAEKAIKRIKGWRNQGSLTDGVIVDKTVVVKAWHKEPDMKNTLSWLDGTVQDDRIIASVLVAQAENASSLVYLVTGDINLQNKADAAFISVSEIT